MALVLGVVVLGMLRIHSFFGGAWVLSIFFGGGNRFWEGFLR